MQYCAARCPVCFATMAFGYISWGDAAMTDSKIKVNDRRMFTADGELREEFRHLEEAPESPPSEEPMAAEPAPQSPEETPPEFSDRGREASAEDELSTPQGAGGATGFQDLVGLLAEYAAVYLGDTKMGDGRSMLDLRAAQAHIDLLDVVREKTRGNLTEVEEKSLEDVLYRLRVAYVEKSRQEG